MHYYRKACIAQVAAGPTLPLDGASGLFFAWSLRRLLASYTGNAVLVRRSSDSAELGFTPSQISDGTLLTWVGAGNDGYVVTRYDQTGNGRHQTQSTNSRQSKIVSSGALVTRGGVTALEAAETGFYESSETSFESDMTFILAGEWSNPGGWSTDWFLLDQSGSGVYAGFAKNADNGSPHASAGSPTYQLNGVTALSSPTRNNLYDDVRDEGPCTIRANSLDLSGWTSLFSGQDGGNNNPLPYQHEAVMLSSGGSVAAVETAMRTYIGT